MAAALQGWEGELGSQPYVTEFMALALWQAQSPLHSIGVGPVKSVEIHYVLCMIRYNMCILVESLLSRCGSGSARLGRGAWFTAICHGVLALALWQAQSRSPWHGAVLGGGGGHQALVRTLQKPAGTPQDAYRNPTAVPAQA